MILILLFVTLRALIHHGRSTADHVEAFSSDSQS